MKDLLHVIVGAGIPAYLENAVRSVLERTTDDVLAIYNRIHGADRIPAYSRLLSKSEPRLEVWERPNVRSDKTGGLYSAYNEALAFASDKYRLISFVQSDMQMMWWSPKILEIGKDELLAGQGSREPNLMCLYTQLPVEGKKRDFYQSWIDIESGYSAAVPGVVDVAMFSVQSLIRSGFNFVGSEKKLSESAALSGWVTKLHPLPFLAAIPFPLSVRSGKLVGNFPNGPNTSPQILKIRDHLTEESFTKSESLHPIYMEDCIQPNGWNSLLPYWPSDTQTPRWFEQRVRICGVRAALQIEIFDGISGSCRKAGLSKFAPGRIRLLSAALQVGLREFSLLLRRLADSLATKFR